MNLLSRRESLILLIGDTAVFVGSLWLTLFLRHFSLPTKVNFLDHLLPFGILYLIWILVFFIAGVYEKHTMLLRNRLPHTLFNAMVANGFIAVIFFYFFPYFGIEPKTNLFIYFVIFSLFVFFWRLRLFEKFSVTVHDNALLIGEGQEAEELFDEINSNLRYSTAIVSSLGNNMENLSYKEVVEKIRREDISIVIADIENFDAENILSRLYRTRRENLGFVSLLKVYEDIFDRIPTSLLKQRLFIENISLSLKAFYDAGKRLMDVGIAVILSIFSLIFYPFVYIAIKIEDGGPIFIFQERVGKDDLPIKLIKFRSMTFDDSNKASTENKITKVGAFLRASRIDELPQLWNVLGGSLSLIGPRPELPGLVSEYEKQIPYYGLRHVIKPGLSGWAQIHDFDVPRRFLDVEKTARKLSYDLYYLKNRSLFLDLKIALKTINTLLSKTGV